MLSRPHLNVVLSLTIASCIVGLGVAQSVSPPQKPPLAEDVFKNIQVFKGQPADQVLPLMQFIVGSLNVHCYHCHDEDVTKRDSDIKAPKLIARRMIQMVADINRTAFGVRNVVTCYSCHRGHLHVAEPVAFSSESMSEAPSEIAAPPSAPAPSVNQLIEKYASALGGSDALRKVSTRVQRGTLTELAPNEPSVEHRFEIFAQGPDKHSSVTHLKDSETVAVYNGDSGWFLFSGNRDFGATGRIWDFPVPSGRLRAMRSEELQAEQLGDPIYLIDQLKRSVLGMTVAGTEKVGGRESYVIVGHTPNLPVVKIYFDTQTGLLARLMFETETSLGRIPHRVDYADYRNVDGIQAPFRWAATDMREAWLYQMQEVRHGVAVDASTFVAPVP